MPLLNLSSIKWKFLENRETWAWGGMVRSKFVTSVLFSLQEHNLSLYNEATTLYVLSTFIEPSESYSGQKDNRWHKSFLGLFSGHQWAYLHLVLIKKLLGEIFCLMDLSLKYFFTQIVSSTNTQDSWPKKCNFASQSIWPASCENGSYTIRSQHRSRRACTVEHSGHELCCAKVDRLVPEQIGPMCRLIWS